MDLQMVSPVAQPPETLEGWYALHQIYTCEDTQDDTVVAFRDDLAPHLNATAGCWGAIARLIGSSADVMHVSFRPTIDAIIPRRSPSPGCPPRPATPLRARSSAG